MLLSDVLNVSLPRCHYPIYFLDSSRENAEKAVPALLSEVITTRQVLVVTNHTIAALYLSRWYRWLEQGGFRVATCIVDDGEQYKNATTLQSIYDTLIDQAFVRNSTLVALGGGVIGDMTGFAAATYQRGVGFVQVPTTLLAQVDSSVGGKTAINHPRGKNMIGAFYQPDAVLMPMDALATLPAREFRAGIAEVIKYGALADAGFLDWLEVNLDNLLACEHQVLTATVRRCCEIKAAIVAADETEHSGQRALLNFGHTFGHAIEAIQHYQGLLHGEAVAVGMVLATSLSCELDLVSSAFCQRLETMLGQAGLPVTIPAGIQPSTMLEAMRYDKKNDYGRLKLIVLEAPGQAAVYEQVPQALIRQVLEQFSS